jgi:hypothetical protein
MVEVSSSEMTDPVKSASRPELMVKGGLATRAEVESGKPAPGSPKATAVTLHEIRRLRKVWHHMLYLMGDSAHRIVLNRETPYVSPTL